MISGVQGTALATGSPARRPGSVRRTTTHDSLRPDGLLGPVTVVARGRDLRTALDGSSTILDTASLELEVSHPERLVGRIAAEPSHPGLQALVGVRASAGFRRAVDEAVPGERGSRSVRFQLLDDLPTALLVSGYAVKVSDVLQPARPKLTLQQPDLCAGWVAGGTLVSSLERTGTTPTPTGPDAPSVEHGDDPLETEGFLRSSSPRSERTTSATCWASAPASSGTWASTISRSRSGLG